METNKQLQFVSIQFTDEDGQEQLAVKHVMAQDVADDMSLNGSCILGSTKCVNGRLYRCMSDPFGDAVWWKTTQHCNSPIDDQS